MSNVTTQRTQQIMELLHAQRRTAQQIFHLFHHALNQAKDQQDRGDMAQTKVAVAEFLILSALQQNGPMTQKAIAQSLHHSEAAISRQVTLAQEAGTICAESDPQDRRLTIISLTSQGQESIDQITQQLQSLLAKQLANISDQDLEQYLTINQKLQKALGSGDTSS